MLDLSLSAVFPTEGSALSLLCTHSNGLYSFAVAVGRTTLPAEDPDCTQRRGEARLHFIPPSLPLTVGSVGPSASSSYYSDFPNTMGCTLNCELK